MVNLIIVSLILLSFILATILILCYIDYRKIRTLHKKPYVSFIIPCYNDADTVGETIISLYASYDNLYFELIVVNDGSKDRSLAVLKKLKKKYGFRLLHNKKNVGKARALNNVAKYAKYDLLFFVDADVVLSSTVINDLLARIERKKVHAVSAPYQPRNLGFIPLMQEIEYIMISFLQGAHNWFSTVSLWGGCFVIKKKAFFKVHCFSENMVTEDMDLALKLCEVGCKVEQSFVPVKTYVPADIKTWLKQKIRWSAGGFQNFVRHFKIFIKSPLDIAFMILFSMLSLINLTMLLKNIVTIDNLVKSTLLIWDKGNTIHSINMVSAVYGTILLQILLTAIYFSVFSVPYVIPMMANIKQGYKLFYVIPFTIIYLPIFFIVSGIGFAKMLFTYTSQKKQKRAW